jgi:two-component system, NtrC family, response regulator
MENLLIIDDNSEIRKQLKWALDRDYHILSAEDRESALVQFKKHRPPVVTLDLGLPPEDEGTSEGFLALEEIIAVASKTKVIVITGRGEREHALRAVHLGAYDFYSKPIDLAELKVILKRAFQLAALEEENRRLQSTLGDNGGMLGIHGQCPQMQEVFRTIRKVATVDVPVLILGESGTGKEMVARAIHERSLRSSGPFIPINCGAIPENLLESELFGHEKGAFTGAQARVRGKVEYAHEGTLFLDEIGEMPPLLQVKLLRFLQEKLIQRVGGREDIAIDTRILAATNSDLSQAIAVGQFREDLYYRLGVIAIQLPLLKERGEDIPLLASLFLQRYGHEFGKKVRGFSAISLRTMAHFDWPGNVREMENKIKRAVVMTEGPIIEPEDLGFEADLPETKRLIDPPPVGEIGLPLEGMTLKKARGFVEKQMIIRAMEQQDGNVSRAAEVLGLTRPTFYDLLKKHGLFVAGE